MDFNTDLIRAEVVGRYKRLIVDVKLRDDTVVPAFCSDDNLFPNLYVKGAEVWIAKIKSKFRKLRYEIYMVNKGDGLVMGNFTQQHFCEISVKREKREEAGGFLAAP